MSKKNDDIVGKAIVVAVLTFIIFLVIGFFDCNSHVSKHTKDSTSNTWHGDLVGYPSEYQGLSYFYYYHYDYGTFQMPSQELEVLAWAGIGGVAAVIVYNVTYSMFLHNKTIEESQKKKKED